MTPSPSARKGAAPLTIHHLRRQVLAQSLPPPTTLARAVGALGFVQADPIRFPARAQDLILRHRVADYSVGDLERAFPRLRLEEEFPLCLRLHAAAHRGAAPPAP